MKDMSDTIPQTVYQQIFSSGIISLVCDIVDTTEPDLCNQYSYSLFVNLQASFP
jgi:hypothetical protein